MISAIRLFFLFVWTFLLMLVAPFFIPITFNRQFPLMAARTIFAPVLMWIAGIKLTVKGKENVPLNEPVIFVANHCSHLDIGCLCGCLPVNLHFIGKKELMFTPVVGWYMFVAGHIFIDRTSRVKSIKSIKKAALKIKQGKSVVMYPEGTRSKDGNLGVFKKGAFHLAKEANVKVIPVCIEGTYKVWPATSNKITPGNVQVTIGKPINSEDYSKQNIKEFAAEAKNQIKNMLTRNNR
jgi:1-acyl-sn-glycerol-3-phosphate acyltransferase